MELVEKRLTEQIIGAAIEVHRELGPGLLESAYEECLCYELSVRGLAFVRQHELIDIHAAQLFSYLPARPLAGGVIDQFQCDAFDGRRNPPRWAEGKCISSSP